MKSRAVFYHLLFWAGIYLLWVFVFRSYAFTLSKTMTIEFCYLLFITADFYAIHYFAVPKLLLKKKYAFFVCSSIVIVAVSAWFRALVAVQMNLHFFHAISTIGFGTLYLNSVVNISFWVLVIGIGKMAIDKMETQQQLEVLEKERIKNELDYLKAQINPHALFNSLNIIYGHIDKSNQTARNILLQFAELLRYQLYDCSAEKVSLENEIGYIRNYVAFQQLRKDGRLVVSLDIENIQTGLTIAPLLLVVVVENAFKFVSNFSDKANSIGISISTKGHTLCCSVSNTREAQQNGSSNNTGGIGITNLKRRLALLYPYKHELVTNMETEFYATNLRIDLT